MTSALLRKVLKECSAREHRAKQYIFFEPKNHRIILKKEDGSIRHIYSCDDTPTLKPMFVNMKEPMQCVMGPRASGKSVECCAKVLMSVYLNPPCRDGVKRARFLVGRGTYGELKTTTIKTFEYWWGHAELEWRIRYDSPICANLKYFDGECQTEIEIIFVSFDDATAAKKALSLELTGAYLNEGASIPPVVVDTLKGSLGRFPPRLELIPDKEYWSGIFIDSNSFADYHPFYPQFVKPGATGHAFYLQPGAMIEQQDGSFWVNPEAENLKNLPAGYYENMAAGSSKSFIRTQICNQFGSHEENKPVHPEYKPDRHSVQKIEIDKAYPLILAHDYGGTNATLVCQHIGGQLRCIKELINMTSGLRMFMTAEVSVWLILNAMDVKVSMSIGDPADNYSHENALKSSQIVTDALGIITRCAKSNVIKTRIDAVDKRIIGSVGISPQLLISREGCPVLHAAMCGKYQLTLVRRAGTEITEEKPLKNEYSHIADCLQYACMEVNKIEELPGLTDAQKKEVVDSMSWN